MPLILGALVFNDNKQIILEGLNQTKSKKN